IGVLSALQYAHHAGIVHRDIKPGNIMLTVTGQVKVMDFGIARALAETSDAVTQTQAVIGTAQYLSPEQARGENVDARSDLYSTGCVLFELLTGRPPFVGDSAVAVAYQHVREHPTPPSALAPDVPPALDRVVIKALAKDREHRYSTASEFLADLQAFKNGGSVSAPPVGAVADDSTQVLPPAALSTIPAAVSYPPPTPPAQQVPASFRNAGILPPTDELDEEEARAKRKKRLTIGLILGGVALILLIILAFFIFKPKESDDPGPTPAVNTTVPKVPASRTVEDSITALEDAKLVAKAGSPEGSDEVAEGLVIRFSPESGDRVKQGDTIEYIVSLGKNTLSMPDVEGMTQSEATEALQKAGYIVEADRTITNSPDVAKDLVVGTDPPKDTPGKRGDRVKLLVSSGQTTVPDCTGKTQQECSDMLAEAGLRVGVVDSEDSDEEPGTVLSQTPSPNSTVDQKTPVNVTIAQQSATVPVPDTEGMTQAAAEQALKDKGFTVNVQQVPSATVPAGYAIRTVPGAGDQATRGSVVILEVSTGPPAAGGGG
ncbi:MAG: PASTA domain-containing protein, partial [Bifidobacteriaceae bacterium]|nr:PASTA domain-containing protein [Bifidobacteriaceae bacterium]